MMKKFLMVLSAVLAGVAGVWAEPVTPRMAEKVARAWAARNGGFAVGDAVAGDAVAVADTNAARTVLWYQVPMAGGSAVMVAPVTEMEPVLASVEKLSGALPARHPLRRMLARDVRNRLRLLGLYAEDPAPATGGLMKLAASAKRGSGQALADDVKTAWGEQGKAKWANLGVSAGVSRLTSSSEESGVMEIATNICTVAGFEAGGRLTHWDQSEDDQGALCYNLYTPGKSVCGCVATAMGAILQFYAVTGALPGVTTPAGQVHEVQDNIRYCTYENELYEAKTRGGVYDWSLLDALTDRTAYATMNEAQRELLGRVAYDAGVAVGMAWTKDESAAYGHDVASGFKKVFGFRDARMFSDPDQTLFGKLIYNQCRTGHPVMLGISGDGGHAVVAAGYGLDSEGVERVRVFTGWGGMGDAWYALPNIDTKSLPSQTGSYRFDVVDCVVTMLGYDTAETVPVVGRLTKSGRPYAATITLQNVMDKTEDGQRVPRRITSDEYGYFATRVAPTLSECRLACDGVTATCEIGKAAETCRGEVYATLGTESEPLCEALPEPLAFMLMTCTTAYTFADAIELALAEGKAVFRLSGTRDDEVTEAIFDYVNELDADNTDGFCDHFVFLFSDASGSEGDGNPSFGVFLPQAADSEGQWPWYNGRLSYDVLDDEAESVDEEELLASVQAVLDEGYVKFRQQTDKISLTVTATPLEAGVTEPAYGVYAQMYTNGQTVVATALPMLTNETAGVVMACTGWVLTRTAADGQVTVENGTGTSAEFAVAANETLTLTWQLAYQAVWIDVADDHNGQYGITSPGSGWYTYGKPVSFVATPKAGFAFQYWTCGTSGAVVDGISGVTTALLTFTAEAPVDLMATYRPGAAGAAPATNTVTMAAAFVEGAVPTDLPAVLVKGVADFPVESVAVGASVAVPAVPVAFVLPTDTYTDATGGVWTCTGYTVSSGSGTTVLGLVPAVSVTATEDLTVTWMWKRVVTENVTPDAGGDDGETDDDGDEPSDERQPAQVPDGLTILATGTGFQVKADITNAVKGWWYSLYMSTSLASDSFDVATPGAGTDVVTAYADADGALSLSLTVPSGAPQAFYKIVVTSDAPVAP